MTRSEITVAWKLSLNELRHGWQHFAVFLICLTLGITIMSSVNSFGYITKKTLKNEAQSLLGADIEIRIRGVAATDQQIEFMQKYGKISYVTTLRSTLNFGEESNLVEIKAIDDNYPLLGELSFDQNISKNEALQNSGIAVDKILLSKMDLKINDKVKIGAGEYIIRATLKNEPDRAVQIFNFGPRVMMSQESLITSKLVSTFSLAQHRYRILVPKNIKMDISYQKSIEQELSQKFPETSWHTRIGSDGNITLKRILNQLLAFMTLSGLSTFLIAGIGIGSSVRSYLNKKIETIAALKVQGASGNVILSTYVIVITLLVVIGGLIGILASATIITSLMPFLYDILPSLKGKSGIHITSMLLATWYGLLVSFLFSMPALLSATNIRPSILFRSNIGFLLFQNDFKVKFITVLLLSLLTITLLSNEDDKLLILGAIVATIFSFTLFYLCGIIIKYFAKIYKAKKLWLKLALNNIYRPGSTSSTVIYAIGISLTILISITLTEANIQARINQLLKDQAPSLFLIDIQPHQKENLTKLILNYANKEQIMLYPMVRGRIIKLNGKDVEKVEISDEINWAVRGDRGLSYSNTPPKNANIVQGKWWQKTYNGPPLLSVDKRFLSGMGLNLGDTITVSILGDKITAKITSAREIDYSTFQLNFAMMMFSPGVIEDFPHTSIATIYIDELEQEFQLIKLLAKDFPGVTAIRTKEIIQSIQNIIWHIATTLKITVAISLLAGLIVLTSTLSSSIKQRMYDILILKILGARRSDVLKSCLAEWIIIAIATSAIASVIGTYSAYIINSRLRALEFSIMPEVTLITIALCIIVICIIGYIGNRQLFNFRPANLLRSY